MPKSLEISNDLRYRIIEDRKDRLSYADLAKKYKLSKSGVYYLCKKYATTGFVENKSGRGRKPKTTARDDSMIVRLAKKKSDISSREIVEDLKLNVSAVTVRRRLKKSGLDSRIQRKKPYISKINKKKRLDFAKKYVSKDSKFWDSVLWSDESKFELFGSKKRKRVWRRSGEALKQANILQTVKHGGGNVMVWGCFASKGVGEIAMIDGKMTGSMYVGVLSQNLKQSATNLRMGRRYIFQQDNDPKHTSKVAKDYFSKNKIQLLGSPPQSPDLNPIENLWSILDQKLPFERRKNRNEFFETIKNEWRKISPDTTQKLVDSMPRRLRAVIEARGGPTKY